MPGSKSTPPNAPSDPKGSPALSTPPIAEADAGAPQFNPSSHPEITPNPNPQLDQRRTNPVPGQSTPAGDHQENPPPSAAERAKISMAALTRRAGGPPPRMPPPAKTAAEAQAYYASLPAIPAFTKWSKWIGVAGWGICLVSGTYLALFNDFGDREHVFMPIRRKVFGVWDRLSGRYDEERARAQAQMNNTQQSMRPS